MSNQTDSNNIKRLKVRAQSFLTENTYDDNKLHQIELELQNQDLLAIQHEYEKSFDRYLNLFETAPTPYFIINKLGMINEINEAGTRLLGFDKSHIINRSFARYLSSESQSLFSVFKQHCLRDKITQTCEIKLMTQHTNENVVQLVGKQQFSQATNDNELLVIATPINALHQANWNTFFNQKAAESDYRHSMTEMAAIISHELNHPLAVILNYVQGCVRRIENGDYKIEDILAALKVATNQSSRASQIILRMREFKNSGTIKQEKTSVTDLIHLTIATLNDEIMDFQSIIDLRLTTLPVVNLDRIHIQQVLSNLVRNSIESMRDNNTSEPKVIIETNRVNKNEIEISVIDNGPGLSKQILPHIYIPHFTTKNYGLGLGLAVSKSIIDAHKGKLSVENNPVGGACFKIILPIS